MVNELFRRSKLIERAGRSRRLERKAA
jgi:hypothetical protein